MEAEPRVEIGDSVIDECNWKEFRETGLLWWINRQLHLFGWSICVEVDQGKITRVFPAKNECRGFSQEIETMGFAMLSSYLSEISEDLSSKCDELSEEIASNIKVAIQNQVEQD